SWAIRSVTKRKRINSMTCFSLRLATDNKQLRKTSRPAPVYKLSGSFRLKKTSAAGSTMGAQYATLLTQVECSVKVAKVATPANPTPIKVEFSKSLAGVSQMPAKPQTQPSMNINTSVVVRQYREAGAPRYLCHSC